MNIFANILVGIDLSKCRPLDLTGLTPTAREPIRAAVELAQANSARLLFFAASNRADDAAPPSASHFVDGGKLLHDLVLQAKSQGVDAQYKMVPGKGWQEIIRQVQRDKYDLVVVGTRDLTGLNRMLFGNTALKLLRRCPCPVLVAKPHAFSSVDAGSINILIATDLKPELEDTLRLGIAMGRQRQAHILVLHVVEFHLDEVCNIGLPDARQDDYRRTVRAQAQDLLNARLRKYQLPDAPIEAHLAGDIIQPDVAIRRFIETHDIHLLVIGTIGRAGIRGITIGNTAERLLPEVHCSVLVVKPPDFACPDEEG